MAAICVLYKLCMAIEYKNDNVLINKNTSLIVRRLPAQRAKPLILELPKSVHSDSLGLDSQGIQSLQSGNTNISEIPVSSKKDEDEQILAVMNDTAQQYRGFMNNTQPNKSQYITSNSVPPSNYMCHRCGKIGEHYIKFCPTNGDTSYDNKKFIKSQHTNNNNNTVDSIQRQFLAPVGTATNTDPNKINAVNDQLNDTADITTDDSIPAELICSIDKKLYKDAVETPCCGSIYCDECIRQYLLDNNYICPSCNQPGVDIQQLQANQSIRDKVQQYNSAQQQSNQSISRSNSKSIDRSQQSQQRSNSRTYSRDRYDDNRQYNDRPHGRSDQSQYQRGGRSKYRDYNDYRNGRNQYDQQHNYTSQPPPPYNQPAPYQQPYQHTPYNNQPPYTNQSVPPPMPLPMLPIPLPGTTPNMPLPMPMLPLPGMLPIPIQQQQPQPPLQQPYTDRSYYNKRTRHSRSHSPEQYRSHSRSQHRYNDNQPYHTNQRSASPKRRLSPINESQRVISPPKLADNTNLNINKRINTRV